MRDRLLRPSFQTVQNNADDMHWAAERIHRLDSALAPWQGSERKALEAEVIGLRHDVRCLEALLRNVGRFYGGWVRLLSSDQASPNYTSGGSALRVSGNPPNKVVIHG
jgi:hypothetical protein